MPVCGWPLYLDLHFIADKHDDVDDTTKNYQIIDNTTFIDSDNTLS